MYCHFLLNACFVAWKVPVYSLFFTIKTYVHDEFVGFVIDIVGHTVNRDGLLLRFCYSLEHMISSQ